MDTGLRPDQTTEESERIKALEPQVKELGAGPTRS